MSTSHDLACQPGVLTWHEALLHEETFLRNLQCNADENETF